MVTWQTGEGDLVHGQIAMGNIVRRHQTKASKKKQMPSWRKGLRGWFWKKSFQPRPLSLAPSLLTSNHRSCCEDGPCKHRI